MAALAAIAAPAAAQPRAANAKAGAEARPSGPLLAVVSIARQRLLVYRSEGLIAQSPVSTGMPGHRTPTGVFTILQKSRFHRSNLYSGAPMPYMQRITWSGLALHAGVLPGFPASHGCIRMPNHFAVELWGMTKIGTRVVVAPDEAPVAAIEDPRLPTPLLTPAPVDDDPDVVSAIGVKVADAEGGIEPSRRRLLNPLERAAATKASAKADVTAKGAAARLAAETASAKAAEARNGATALEGAEQALAAALRQRERAAKLAADTRLAPASAERAGQALDAAEDVLAAAQSKAEDARLVEAALAQEASWAAMAAHDADSARRDAVAALQAVERAASPLSIFVSRKAGRVYVRQGWASIYEAPVTFTDAAPALGTHLYLATGPAADGETMRWMSVSLPGSARARARRGAPGKTAAGPGPAQETAVSVLGRFALSDAAQRFIADRLWTGATLIVSDQGISGETGTDTDFIVLTR